MTREFLQNGLLADIVTNGSSNLSINKLEANSGQFALYGAKGFIKKIDFFQQKKEYLAIIKDGAGFGRIGIYPPKSSVVGTMQYLIPKGQNVLEFVYYYLKTVNFEKYVKGATIPHIYFRDYQKEPVPIFSIERQKQIAKRLKLFDISKQKFEQEISYQQIQLKKLRQQILQEAIEGKLTAEWRQKNPDVEPASELLSRIQAEKEQLIKDKKIKKQKPLRSISDEEKPFDLPDGWVWCRLEKVCTFANGKAHEQFINVSGKYTLINSKFVSTDGAIIKRTAHCMSPVRKDDVTIVMSDVPNGRALARCFLVGEDDMYSLNQRIGALSPVSDMFPGFFKFLLDRNPHFLQFDDGKKQTNLRKEQILLCPLGVPPLSEQKTIAIKVEKLLALCDQMETQITASQTHAKQLMQAVLKEAFSANSKESLAG